MLKANNQLRGRLTRQSRFIHKLKKNSFLPPDRGYITRKINMMKLFTIAIHLINSPETM